MKSYTDVSVTQIALTICKCTLLSGWTCASKTSLAMEWADAAYFCAINMSPEPNVLCLAGHWSVLHVALYWLGNTLQAGLLTSVLCQAGGVLLACSDAASCSAAATAVAQSLPASCSQCLHHFLPDHQAGGHSSTVRADPEVAGQAQKALVAQLQQCSHAVVIVNSIDTVPPAVLPVLITALSEQGHFEHSGNQVDATKAFFVGILQVPPATLHQVQYGHSKGTMQALCACGLYKCEVLHLLGHIL